MAEANRWAAEALLDFRTFLRHVRTTDREGNIRSFPVSWPYLDALARSLEQHRLNCWLKSRQMLVSWLVTAWAVWRSLNRAHTLTLLVSKGEREAIELNGRAKFIFESLPAFLKRPLVSDTKSLLEWTNGSRLFSLPASPGIGRTFTASAVVLDEAAHLESGPEMWAGLRPTLGETGRVVMLSTPRGFDPLFSVLWFATQGAFHRERVHYSLNPEMTPSVIAEIRRGLLPGQWEQEYELEFTAFSGLVFPEFDEETHVVAPRAVPAWWTRVVGLDPGLNGFGAAWQARGPEGQRLFYDEHLGQNVAFDWNVHSIIARSAGQRITANVCDPAATGRNILTRTTLWYEIERQGLAIVEANNAVEVGLSRMKQGLRNADGEATVFVFASCLHLLEALRRTTWEEVRSGRKPHVLDAARYAHMYEAALPTVPRHDDGPSVKPMPPGLDLQHLDPMSMWIYQARAEQTKEAESLW